MAVCLNVGPEAPCYDGTLRDNLQQCLREHSTTGAGYHKVHVQVPGGGKKSAIDVLCIELAVKLGDEPAVCEDCRAMGAHAFSWFACAQHCQMSLQSDACRFTACSLCVEHAHTNVILQSQRACSSSSHVCSSHLNLARVQVGRITRHTPAPFTSWCQQSRQRHTQAHQLMRRCAAAAHAHTRQYG